MAEALVAGVALQAYGGLKSTNDQYNAAQTNIEQLNAQADEMAYRNQLNLQKTEIAGQQVMKKQAGAYAASGVDLSSGAPLDVMEQTAATISQELVQAKRENAFAMNQLRFQMGQEQTLAGQNRMAGLVSTLGGSLISGAQAKQSLSGAPNVSKGNR